MLAPAAVEPLVNKFTSFRALSLLRSQVPRSMRTFTASIHAVQPHRELRALERSYSLCLQPVFAHLALDGTHYGVCSVPFPW